MGWGRDAGRHSEIHVLLEVQTVHPVTVTYQVDYT